ncbi:MAG: 2,3-bisphosphoglycerate-independent phosphoglycerate mutase, partial [Actinomycetota bacterium]|nr:2,3-bisphosphoglycerate-independent phosphoglycerate mutase [Actinomycetota bacterium]
GPGHLTLFGYDPIDYQVGRGILSALGVDFDLKKGDIAARINFATVDEKGNITDRRAGRIATEKNRELCEMLKSEIKLDFEGNFFLETEKEHRAVLVIRGQNLGGKVADTDPQKTGVPPLEPEALDTESEKTAEVVKSFLEQAKKILSHEKANMLLLRGFEKYSPLPTLKEKYKLNGLCIAEYPMYRGISKLVGMDIAPHVEGIEASFEMLSKLYGDEHSFYFLHVKKTDSAGENGDFEEKVKIIEEVDKLIPSVVELNPDVLIVTGDHSTPALLKAHSFHPVPVILKSKTARVDRVSAFDELSCSSGSLGLRPAIHLMGLALGHAGRLKKFGA